MLLIIVGGSLVIAFLPMTIGGHFVPGLEGLLIVSITFGLLIGLTGVWLALSPPKLRIAPAGVTFTTWRSWSYRWKDVHNFRPMGRVTGFPLGRMVGFDFVADHPQQARRTLREFNKSLAGAQAAFPGGWEMKAPKLADLLNQARERWLTA